MHDNDVEPITGRYGYVATGPIIRQEVCSAIYDQRTFAYETITTKGRDQEDRTRSHVLCHYGDPLPMFLWPPRV